MAKAPFAGRVKTRLCPPLSLAEAAEVAEASLVDTLQAVAGSGADRRIIALDGDPGPWLPPGFTIIAQRGPSFAARLAAAWSDSGGPGLQIGMDTPQVTAGLLNDCLAATADRAVTATLGAAVDGGWWALGLRCGWDTDAFSSVPMSTTETGRRQLVSLRSHGHTVAALPVLNDVDTIDDAWAVAALAPRSRFAQRLQAVSTLPA